MLLVESEEADETSRISNGKPLNTCISYTLCGKKKSLLLYVKNKRLIFISRLYLYYNLSCKSYSRKTQLIIHGTSYLSKCRYKSPKIIGEI
jgi:hypothetical protein